MGAMETNITGKQADRIVLNIEGMTCASCVGRVETILKAQPGVETASVNLATERAEITGSALDRAALVEAIEDAGYAAAEKTVTLDVEGMTCASCVGRVEKALMAVPGVKSASVNLATEQAIVSGTPALAELLEAVDAAGYDARAARAPGGATADLARRKAAEEQILRRDLLIAAMLTLPVFVLEMGSHLFSAIHMWVMDTISMETSWLVQFLLTTATLAGPGRRFYQKGVPALMRFSPDMNSLVAVGTAAAYAYSLVATFAPALLPTGTVHVYYEAAAVIVTLILFGRWMEARAKGRTSAAIRRLAGLQVRTARVVRTGGTVDVAAEDLRIGDVIEVRPGERIATDGTVIEGNSWVDESMISGEPVPLHKQVGAHVTGGTVNQAGAFTFRATAVGDATMLAHIIRMVEEAQGGKLPIQSMVDKVTLWFVPAVMGLALLTFAVWLVFGPDPALTFALVNGVAVLIIACPCAMGLATPTSIMVGTGRGAELGILFRKGEALQALQDVTIIALDKTGTLTEGKPSLSDFETADGVDRAKLLAAVAAIESKSEHPIGRALVEAAAAQGLELPVVSGFASRTGEGVYGTVDGKEIRIGAAHFMQSLGVDVLPFAERAALLAGDGKTPLYVANGQTAIAVLAVSDTIKPTTQAAIRALHAMGLKVAMITGDNQATARVIAGKLSIDEVVAEVLPAGKVAALRRLKQGGRVAFIGDGINDAPALAEADVGIAVGTGTDIAMESADVVLVSGRLTGVPDAIALSRATMSNIRQNLFWAFAYNAALIPLAAGVLYPSSGILLSPVFAAGAMALSSVFVLGNALRLQRFSPAREFQA